MKKQLHCAGLALVLLLAGRAIGVPVTVYQNTDGPLFAPTFSQPHTIDDGSYLTPIDHPPMLITRLNFAFFVLGSGQADFDVRLNFYDTLSPNTQAQFDINSDLLEGITVPIRGAMPGIRSTGLVDIESMLGHGILFGDSDWALEVKFLEPGASGSMSNRATPLFAGGEPVGGPRIGGSQDRYWCDANQDGRMESNEGRSFDGPPRRANFYLVLQGEPVPEPSTLLVLALAVVVRRRRRG